MADRGSRSRENLSWHSQENCRFSARLSQSLPGTEGLLHISQIAKERINKVTDVLQEGDEVMVKVLEMDKSGKIRLSRKEALDAEVK